MGLDGLACTGDPLLDLMLAECSSFTLRPVQCETVADALRLMQESKPPALLFTSPAVGEVRPLLALAGVRICWLWEGPGLQAPDGVEVLSAERLTPELVDAWVRRPGRGKLAGARGEGLLPPPLPTGRGGATPLATRQPSPPPARLGEPTPVAPGKGERKTGGAAPRVTVSRRVTKEPTSLWGVLRRVVAPEGGEQRPEPAQPSPLREPSVFPAGRPVPSLSRQAPPPTQYTPPPIRQSPSPTRQAAPPTRQATPPSRQAPSLLPRQAPPPSRQTSSPPQRPQPEVARPPVRVLRQQVVTFWGGKPGAGRSTLALALSDLLARTGEIRVCTVDLNPYNSSLAPLLGKEQEVPSWFHLAAALQQGQPFPADSLRWVRPNWAVLSGPDGNADWVAHLDRERVGWIVAGLRSQFDYIILDPEARPGPVSEAAASLAQRVLVTVSPDYPDVLDTARAFEVGLEAGWLDRSRCHLLLSRWLETPHLTAAEVADCFLLPVGLTVPLATELVLQASGQGLPATQVEGAAAAGFQQAMGRLVGLVAPAVATGQEPVGLGSQLRSWFAR